MTFGNTVAVDHISFVVQPSEIVALLGPSGCGKTTTLRLIAGLERPGEGEISINGRVVAGGTHYLPPEKRDIGLVFQSYALWPHMTVFQNVALGLKLRRVAADEMRSRVQRTLEFLGLLGLEQRYPSQLSGGQQQRVALARSLVVEPAVLLFDEPLSNLDAKIRERVRFELRELLKRLGIATLYVTHDQAEAMVIADRIIVMNRGRIEQQGTPGQIYETPASRFVAEFVGWANFVPVRLLEAGRDGQPHALQSSDGLVFRTTSAVEGQSGMAAFRPEHAVVVAKDGPALNTWPVRVERQVYLGSLKESHGRLGQWPIRIDGWSGGEQEILLHVPPEHVMYFPNPETGD